MIADGDLLVIGVGNVLLRDEGTGVRVVEALGREVEGGRERLPASTRLVDGGTLGLDLLPMIEDARAVVLVDAVNLRGRPGDVAVLRGDALHGTLANHVSPHQIGIADLLGAARLAGTLPDAIALVGIQPAEIAIGLELSGPVAAAVPRAVAYAAAAARELDRVAPGPGIAFRAGEAAVPPQAFVTSRTTLPAEAP